MGAPWTCADTCGPAPQPAARSLPASWSWSDWSSVWSRQQDEVYESKGRVIVTSAQAETSQAYAGGLLSEQRAASYVEVDRQRPDGRAGRDRTGARRRPRRTSSTTSAPASCRTPRCSSSPSPTPTPSRPAIVQGYADELVEIAKDIETPDRRRRAADQDHGHRPGLVPAQGGLAATRAQRGARPHPRPGARGLARAAARAARQHDQHLRGPRVGHRRARARQHRAARAASPAARSSPTSSTTRRGSRRSGCCAPTCSSSTSTARTRPSSSPPR